jgi:chorismate mutase
MAVRAVRGAIQLDVDERSHLLASVEELVTELLGQNDLHTDDLISMLFTATPDLHAEFPAVAARELGIGDVPLLCAQELDITGAMPRVIRVMVHAETSRSRADLRHVYLRGAVALRRDLAQ